MFKMLRWFENVEKTNQFMFLHFLVDSQLLKIFNYHQKRKSLVYNLEKRSEAEPPTNA